MKPGTEKNRNEERKKKTLDQNGILITATKLDMSKNNLDIFTDGKKQSKI